MIPATIADPPMVPDAVSSLAPWAAVGALGSAELRAAAVLVRADPLADDSVHLAAALALWAPLNGHACIDLARASEMVRSAMAADEVDTVEVDTVEVDTVEVDTVEVDTVEVDPFDGGVDSVDDGAGGHEELSRATGPTARLPWPTLATWLEALGASSICRVVDGCDPEPVLDHHPLVLHGTMLYTQRQWVDECVVAADLRRRAGTFAATSPELDASTAALLERLLPATEDGQPNLQHQAAVMALRSRLAVIVGGPGTGKTHTIARLMAVLVRRAESDGRSIRIALAAPTGKAAARMGEAVTASLAGMDEPSRQLADVRPTTIHRLLGVRGRRTRFVNDADHPLDHDVVVIDEASMVALPMMARLLEALRPETTLILVGDPDQLESIEVGSVLADIVAASGSPTSPLARCVIRLERSRRHASDSPIGPLADAIRQARSDEVVRLLTRPTPAPGPAHDAITFIDTARTTAEAVETQVRNIVVPPLQAAAAAARVGHSRAALEQFADVRVLCAHRRGPFGVERWNRLIESWLLADTPSARPPRYYPGRALLVTRNDQRQRIANGDTGIIVADEAGLRAAFATADGLRLLAPAQLDTVETAYAMTIHKSQGSEYRTVVVILPTADSALIGRELLYTAVTRSADRLVVVGTPAAIIAAVNRPGRRVTGLAAALA